VAAGQRATGRGYTMRARQETVEQTRLRITEATMRLHERVGPRATTVSAIADEAGVTRLTVYRHFPDDDALVMACSTHWGALHPRPDPARWVEIEDPLTRLKTALTETYAWNRTAAPMMTKILRDLDVMPAFVARFLAQDEQARVATLAVGLPTQGRPGQRIAAAITHALRLTTWQSLCVDGELDDGDAVDLMVGTLAVAIRSPGDRSGDGSGDGARACGS
jgi:AcrR family transcriptional regulator